VEVVASLSQGRTAAAQCCLFTYKSVPVIFEPPCNFYFTQRLFMMNCTGCHFYPYLEHTSFITLKAYISREVA